MTAPVLWILIPLAVAGVLLLLRGQNLITLIACLFTLFLTLAAWLIPIDSPLALGSLSFTIRSSQEILGRHLVLNSGDRSFLILLYGSTVFWFVPAASLQIARRLIPLGLAVAALLVAALAVEPVLYAALLIETAVLLSVPLLSTPGQQPGKGLLRFIIFQTLAVPFILFSGWILAGIEANPGNLGLVRQAAIFLGLGFAFLLAVFPFYTWIPLLAEEVHPYILGFVLWVLPTAALFFGLGFMDRYAWLRDTPALGTLLTVAGGLMVTTGGILAVFQQHLSRMMGYAVIIETGFSLLALSLVGRMGLSIFLLLLIPRALCLGLWALSLSILKEHIPDLRLNDVRGYARVWPFAATGLILGNLALAGMPLLAGFPAHQAIWQELARSSLPLSLWVFIGSLCFAAGAVRMLASISGAAEGARWEARETVFQRVLFGAGWIALLLLGLFPQWALPLWTKLPAIFEHFGQ